MAHIELQITAADPPYFVLEPLGVQLAIQAGDTLSVHKAYAQAQRKAARHR